MKNHYKMQKGGLKTPWILHLHLELINSILIQHLAQTNIRRFGLNLQFANPGSHFQKKASTQ